MIIRSNSSAVDFALLKDGKLTELNKEVEDNKFSVGDIFIAKDYYLPETHDLDKAWEYAALACKTTQNFNRMADLTSLARGRNCFTPRAPTV